MIHQTGRNECWFFQHFTKVYDKIWVYFGLNTRKRLFLRGFILEPTERAYFLQKRVLRIFKITLRFMFLCDNNWKFWTFSIIQLWKKFSEKLEYCFLFESTNISIQNCSIKSSFVLTLLKQIEWVIQNGPITNRSSHQRCSIKKGVLRNFAKFTRKHLCQTARA